MIQFYQQLRITMGMEDWEKDGLEISLARDSVGAPFATGRRPIRGFDCRASSRWTALAALAAKSGIIKCYEKSIIRQVGSQDTFECLSSMKMFA